MGSQSAAVHRNASAIDASRFIAAEKGHQGGSFFRSSESPNRDGSANAIGYHGNRGVGSLGPFLQQRSQSCGIRETGKDVVDSNAVASKFRRKRARPVANGAAHRVRNTQALDGHDDAGGDDVDDSSKSAGRHGRADQSNQCMAKHEVRVHARLQIVRGGVDQWSGWGAACIVNQKLPAVLGHARGCRLRRRLPIAEVSHNAAVHLTRRGVQGIDCLLHRVGSSGHDGHIAAFQGQPLSAGPSNALRRAPDQRRSSMQSIHARYGTGMAQPNAVNTSLRPFGTTIFSEMTALATTHGAINLGQGFPDFDGPDILCTAVTAAMAAGHNQYAPMGGCPELQQAISLDASDAFGRHIDPATEVTVTAGCTEAIAATLLGLLNPGDEVIAFEPFYDSYPACCAIAGATFRTVTLQPPAFAFDADALEAAVTSNTRAILVNTPHNPTGRVATALELDAIASVCRRHDLIAITDEVYDRIVLADDAEHLCLAAREGMADRTITLRSLGKTFSMTGWKIGWAIAPPHLGEAVRAAHQFLTYAVSTPMQHAAAAALGLGRDYYDQLRDDYRRRRDLLLPSLSAMGLKVMPPEGTYFVMADHSALGHGDDRAFCRWLIEAAGVAAIPPGSFYLDPACGADLVRFAFCKRDATLRTAVERLAALA